VTETPPDPDSALPLQPASRLVLRGTRESCGGRVLAASVLLVLAVYGAVHGLASGGRLRPERVSLVPKSLGQPASAQAASPASPSLPPGAVRYDTKPKSTVLWPQTKGPGPFGL
jgi:hypothetical protein